MVGIFACQVQTSIDLELRSRNEVQDIGSRKISTLEFQGQTLY
jgi:hypothetical protein